MYFLDNICTSKWCLIHLESALLSRTICFHFNSLFYLPLKLRCLFYAFKYKTNNSSELVMGAYKRSNLSAILLQTSELQCMNHPPMYEPSYLRCMTSVLTYGYTLHRIANVRCIHVFSVLNTLGLVQCTVLREEWEREISAWLRNLRLVCVCVIALTLSLASEACFWYETFLPFIWGKWDYQKLCDLLDYREKVEWSDTNFFITWQRNWTTTWNTHQILANLL